MQRPVRWQSEVGLVGFTLGQGWMVAQIFGHGSAFLILGLAAYCAWHLLHLLFLLRWLRGVNRAVPDNVPGLWHELYARIAELRQHARSRQQELLTVVREFRDSTNSLADAAVTLGRHGEILWFNRAAENLLGLRPRIDRGQRISNLLRHPKFIELIASTERTASAEMTSPSDPASVLHVQLTYYRHDARLLLARDVTRLHKLEQVRQDFVANVSHELRTPITVLSGYLETLGEAGDKLGRYQKPIAQMQNQAARMRSIVDDLLLLSRLDNERTRMAREFIDVPALIRQLADDARILSGSQGHHIATDIDAGLGLQAAPKELHSALANLVANAVRYTPAGGQVHLRWTRNELGEACFAVTDSGVGIARHHLERLTERFYRVDEGRSREVGGTGLGLAIVKHVMERHGGVLRIKSEVGQGSVFTCVFPAAAAGELAARN